MGCAGWQIVGQPNVLLLAFGDRPAAMDELHQRAKVSGVSDPHRAPHMRRVWESWALQFESQRKKLYHFVIDVAIGGPA